MHPTTTIPRPRGRQTGGALLIMLATTAASAWLAAQRPVTPGAALAASAATAAGTMAMGLYLARWTPYPRWGFLGAAAVLAMAALAGPMVARDAAAWAEGARPLLWMHPWYLMIIGLTPPTSRRGVCSPEAPWAGWLLVGSATVLAAITWGATLL